MRSEYFQKNGEIITIGDMTISKAKEFAELIENGIVPFIKLIEIKRLSEVEIIIFDIEIEASQIRKNDIKNKERISVSFNRSDITLPEIEALRMDFPKVPHLNGRHEEIPKSICLFNKTYEEIKHTLNPAKILNQIRYWLEATARGDLHDQKQALEPIMFNSNYTIYLPSNFLDSNHLPNYKIKKFKENMILLPIEKNEPYSNFLGSVSYYPILLSVEPQLHGDILRIPANLEELDNITQLWGINLITISNLELQKKVF